MLSKFLAFAFCVLGLASSAHAQERPQFRLFAIRDGKKWGFIDRTGKVVVRPRFDELGARSEGTWAVKSGTKWGFVAEATGEVSVATRYTAVGLFSEGLCPVAVGNKVGFIGKNGVFQIPLRFTLDKFDLEFGLWSSRYLFSEGISAAEITENEARKSGFKGTWGYIDRRGAWKMTPRFRQAEPMSDGMAQVTLEDEAEGQEGYVAPNGRFIPLPPGGSGIYSEPFFEGLAVVAARVGNSNRLLYGFLDKQGKWAIEPRFLAVMPGGDPIKDRIGFQDGLATVFIGDTPANVRLGWIDKQGKWAIEPRFNGGGVGFIAGITPARIGEKAGEGLGGFIDRTGQFVIQPQFEKMGVFTDVLAPVQKKGEKWRYIDKSGATVIPPRFDYVPLDKVIVPEMMALQFHDGLAYVADGTTRGYIDTAGKWVWKESGALPAL